MEGHRTISMSILAHNHSLFRSGTILYLLANTCMVLFWTYMSLFYAPKERSRRSKICLRISHRWWSECIYCFHGSSAQFGWCGWCKAVRGSVGIGWSAYWRQAHGSRSVCGSSTGWISKYVGSLWCTEACRCLATWVVAGSGIGRFWDFTF